LTRDALNPRLPAIFSVLAALFFALSIASGIASLTALRQLSDTNYDDSGLALVQIRLHYSLLMSELGNIDAERPQADVTEAVLQFDILHDRLRSLPNRPPYNEILTAPDLEKVERIFSSLDAETPMFDAAASRGATALRGVAGRLNTFRDDVNLLAGRVVQQMRIFRDTRRAEIVRSTRFLIISTAGLVITGAIFAFLLWRSQSRLRRQNRALEDVSIQLTDANQAKSAFLASISHELRTPLNAIIGFSDIINRQIFGMVGNMKYLEYSKDINLSGMHLLNLINDILDLSKIEAGEFQVNPTDIDVRDAVLEAIRITDIHGDRGDDRFTLSISKDAERLYADPRSFLQILINLLSNAVKYSTDGAPIDITAEPGANAGVQVRVTDRGIGIPQEDLQLVLEPFGQSRRNSEHSHEGTGLGLSLSKQLMELNGGTLDLQSKSDWGTTVTLWFPSRPA
jgi:signal transduction histidine kinase